MLESFHHGVVAVVDPAGNLIFSKGDAFALIYPRSATKPIQAAAMRRAGLSLPEAQAVMTMASHYATDRQVELVSKVLASHYVSESQLGCPAAVPWNLEAKVGKEPKPIYMNCSGKHAGFLATSKLNGWDLETYLQRSHPMQKRAKALLEEFAGEKIVKTSTDGCGAPLFALSTIGLARALSRFVQEEPELVAAALANPELIGDENTPDAGFLRQGLFSKLGAEGVFMVATPDGHALSLKIADGSLRKAAAYSALLLYKLKLISMNQMNLAMNTDQTEVKGGQKTVGDWEYYF